MNVVAAFYLIGWGVRVPFFWLMPPIALVAIGLGQFRAAGLLLLAAAWWLPARWAAQWLRDEQSLAGALVLLALTLPWVWYAGTIASGQPSVLNLVVFGVGVVLCAGDSLAVVAAIQYQRLEGR